ncbi:MAG: hypothetical protein ACJ8AH_07570, partial [Stellaceae bacterium]
AQKSGANVRLPSNEPVGLRPAMAVMGHFDQFPPTSPSVGCRLGQGTFAEAIRQLLRRAEKRTARP